MKSKKLSNIKCTACNSKTNKLNQNQIEEYIKQLINWQVNKENEMIFKKFIFKNYKQALKLVNLISEIAENEGHHPDLSIGYGYCLVMIHTHAIKGLSINDFILASKIDLISI